MLKCHPNLQKNICVGGSFLNKLVFLQYENLDSDAGVS